MYMLMITIESLTGKHFINIILYVVADCQWCKFSKSAHARLSPYNKIAIEASISLYNMYHHFLLFSIYPLAQN